jgi:thiosulfate/3-mercaptopyruvate sulfurtransferase
MDVLVSTEWLADELGAPDLVVLDCTVWLRPGDNGFESISGRDDWAEGHIPGAGFADLDGALSDPSSPWRYAVPPAEDFAAAMAALGVDNTSRVVLYDENQSMWAARVWWMLRWIGFDNAAVLDGGMKAWRAEGRPISTDTPATTMGTLDVDVRPGLIADKAEVLASIGDGATCLVDALPEPLFTGEVAAYRRAGHIPGATNTSAAGLLDPDTGRYLDRSQLEDRFPDDRGARIITYCGGGIAASSDALILTMLGYDDVAVYTASLQEWTADPDAPLTTG